jgi:hypothetical protein
MIGRSASLHPAASAAGWPSKTHTKWPIDVKPIGIPKNGIVARLNLGKRGRDHGDVPLRHRRNYSLHLRDVLGPD